MLNYSNLVVVTDNVEALFSAGEVFGTMRASIVLQDANDLLNEMITTNMIPDEQLMMLDLLLLAYGSEDATDQRRWATAFIDFMAPHMSHQLHITKLINQLRLADDMPDAWKEQLCDVATNEIIELLDRCKDQLMPIGKVHNQHTADQLVVATELVSVLNRYNM